jgi:hypothetical protein
MARTQTANVVQRVTDRVGQTLALVASSVRRRGSRAVFAGVTVGYLVTFLWAMGDLNFRRTGVGVVAVVDDPLARMLEPGPGPYTHEPVALVELGVGVLQFSPLNTALGLGIALLVGVNMAFTAIAVTQPKSCSIGTTAGVMASIPALVAGSACCAPAIFLALGITASGVALTAFLWLLPLGIVLLLVTPLYLAGQIDPAAL